MRHIKSVIMIMLECVVHAIHKISNYDYGGVRSTCDT